MITIIDYGLKNIYEVINLFYSDTKFKIDGVEVTIPKGESSITCLPKTIEKQIKNPGYLNYYVSEEGTMTVEEYNTRRKALGPKVWDGDNEVYIYATVEERDKFNDFITKWKAVYTESSESWEEITFDIIYKEYIEPEYRDYISSQVILPVRNVYNHNEIVPGKAICTYVPNDHKLFWQLALQKGFEEVPDRIGADHTKGKKFCIASTFKYSGCNGKYLTNLYDNLPVKNQVKGSYKDCVNAHLKNVHFIESYLDMILEEIDGVQITKFTRSKIVEELHSMFNVLSNVKPIKQSHSEYRSVLSNLKRLANEICENKI